jgi:protein-L-isoaspartate(D-aspartate) O-methyltransferase
MVSIMNEALQLEVGHKVLEVGAGSGWHAATIAEIIAPSDSPRSNWGHVYTVEIVLVEQLKPRGIMLIPVGDLSLFQSLMKITKESGGKIKEENLGGVAFVPLTGRHGHAF